MRKISNEIMTGVMVILCAALFIFFMYKTGKIGYRPEVYQLKALFNTASGMQKNAPVMLAGVEVGEVKDIELDYTGDDTKIIFTLQLDKQAKVRTDSAASINSLGLMGEKYIEISKGSAGMPFLKPGATITGEEPFQFEKLAKKGEEIAENLDTMLVDVRTLVNNLNGVVTDNKNGIDSIIMDLEVTAENFKEFSEDIKNHPWKLLMKGKEKKQPADKDEGEKTDQRRLRRR